jgi:TolA-binding protein
MRQYFFSLLFILLIFSAPLSLRSQEKENAEFKLAVNLYNDGMYDLAVEQFKNFVTAYPNTAQGVEARFYWGNTLMKLKRYDEARITFQNFALAYVDHPKAPEAWMNVGEALLALKNEREAASAFERVKVFHAKSPLAPEALLKSALLYRRIGERESAKKALRTIIQDYPGSSSVLSARLAIGEMYAEEGQTELAEREARHVSESEVPAPVKASALFAIGKLQMASSLFEDAEAEFKSVMTAYKGTPAATAATFEMGKLAMNARNYSSAVEQFKKIIGEDAVDDSLQAQAMFEMAGAYAASKDYLNAQQTYEKLLATFPKNHLTEQAVLGAGRSASMNSKYKDALQHFRKIIALQSSSFRPKALVLAAQAAVESRQFSEAVKLYSSFLDDYSDNPFADEITLKLGALYEKDLNDYRKAVMTYNQMSEKYPQSEHVVDGLSAIGACQEKLSDYDGALKTYQEIQTRYPGNDLNDDIQRRIEHLQDYKLKNRDAGMEKLAKLIGEVVTQQSKAELSYQLGEIYFNDLKDYAAAAKQFTIAIDGGLDEKRFVESYYLRARAFHLQSESDSSAASQAILYYTAFLKQFPLNNLSEEAAFYSFKLMSERTTSAEIIHLGKEFLSKHPASPYKDQVLQSIGTAAVANQDYTEAIASFGTIIREIPTSPLLSGALLQRGNVHLTLQHPDSAASDWGQAVSASPPDAFTPQALWNLAEHFWQNKKYADAISFWKRIATEFFYTTLAEKSTARLADCYLANGDFDEMISFSEDLLKRQRSSPFLEGIDNDLLFDLANAYEKKGDRQKAIQYYNMYLNHDCKDTKAVNAYYALGVFARAQGKTSQASAYFKEASALGGTASGTSDIADLLFQTEQYADAAKQYSQLAQSVDSISEQKRFSARAIVATLRSEKLAESQKLIADFDKTYGKDKQYHAEFEYERGSSYYRKQDYANAKKVFEKLADNYDDTRFGAWGHYYLGKILEVTNKPEEAAKKYEGVLKKFSDSDVVPRVLLSLGNMHFNAERFEDAIRYYQRITGSPETAGDILSYAMNNLIEAYESTKLYDAALKTAKDFIERYPNDESIIDKKIKIGSLYTKIGYYDQAVLHFQNLLDEAGSSLEAEIRYDIGEAYYYKGDYQQAILEFLKVPYLVSKQGKVNWTATSFYMAGQSYEKMSKFDEAIGMYQQVIERTGIDATFKTAAKKEIDRVKSLIKKGSR